MHDFLIIFALACGLWSAAAIALRSLLLDDEAPTYPAAVRPAQFAAAPAARHRKTGATTDVC